MREKLMFGLLFLTLAILLSACGSPATVATSVPVVQTPPLQAGSISINGAGATFPYPLYSRWFYEFAFVDGTAKFNYQSIGSGGGIAQITAKTVDFGASDAILSDAQLQAAKGVQMFPTVAGAIVPTFSLKGDDGKAITATIKFPHTALADIYLGKIKKWNDPALAAANPDLKLPNKDIIAVYRSDGSGTTFVFTSFLSQVSSDFKDKVGSGTSVKWTQGLGGKGNEGVAGTVSQNDGAIGYVELAYATQNKLAFGTVQNKAGEYVIPSDASVQAAMADFGTDLGDKLATLIVDAPSKNAYPIAAYTYLLVYMDQTDCVKGQKIVAFVKWALSDGTKFATELQYVPLPADVKTQVLAKLGKITCQGKPL